MEPVSDWLLLQSITHHKYLLNFKGSDITRAKNASLSQLTPTPVLFLRRKTTFGVQWTYARNYSRNHSKKFPGP